MAEAYRFVDGVSYTEAQYMEYQKRLMSKNGVVANENLESSTSELAVIAATPNAMSVLVGTGECFTQGEFYQNTSAKTLTISAADASWNRYDRIVVGVDWSANTCGPYVLTGTPAASPAEPSLTQTAAKWEIPLAKLLVTAGVTEISGNLATLITDERYWCACNMGTFKLDTSGNLDASSNRIVNLHNPIGDQDADTLSARNAAIALVGGNWKSPVVAATTAAITLASDVENGDTLDGVTLATGDRILVKNQSDGGNGIYVVAASGAPSRATDFDSAADAWAASIPVKGGTANAGTAWRVTNATIANFGTTVLTFAMYLANASNTITAGDCAISELHLATAPDITSTSYTIIPTFTTGYDVTVRHDGTYRVAIYGNVVASGTGTFQPYVNGAGCGTTAAINTTLGWKYADIALEAGDVITFYVKNDAGSQHMSVYSLRVSIATECYY